MFATPPLRPSLNFVSPPVQTIFPPETSLSEEDHSLVTLENQEMLQKGAIHMVPPSQATPGYLSCLFLVPKKGGVQRLVVNLKPLNQFLPYEHFKMEGIHIVKYLFKKRRFHGQDRSQRCIFNSPPLSGTSKVCEVQLGGHPLQVCLPSLWSVHCPSSIYQNHETSCSSVKAAGH